MESDNSAGPSSKPKTYGLLTVRNDLLIEDSPSNLSERHIPVGLMDPEPIQDTLPTDFLDLDSAHTISCKNKSLDVECILPEIKDDDFSKEADTDYGAALIDGKQEGWPTLATGPAVTNFYDPYELSVNHSPIIESDDATDKAEFETNSNIWTPTSIKHDSPSNMLISVKETGACRFSKFTGWHLLRATGLMNITIYSRFLTQENVIRLTLKRSHPDYSDFPIDKICINHQSSAPFNVGHVLQPGPNEENWIFGAEGKHKSLVYFLDGNQSSKKLEIRIWCSDTCRTNSSLAFQQKEISRDSNLEVSIENKVTKQTIETQIIKVWTKSSIKLTDLQKKVRREEKGALTMKRKSKLSIAASDPATTTKANEIILESCKQLDMLGFTDKEMMLMFKNGVLEYEALKFENMLKRMRHDNAPNK